VARAWTTGLEVLRQRLRLRLCGCLLAWLRLVLVLVWLALDR
jgi:hypothetical protein